MLDRAGLILNHFESDPRGYAVYIVLTDSSYNSFGGRENGYGADDGGGARSAEAPRGSAIDDAPWGGSDHDIGVRAHHRGPDAISERQKKLSSYLGLVPAEDSSGERRRLGHISKQGNSLLRFLLVEAAQAAARSDPQWQRQFLRVARNGVSILNLCSPKEVHGVSCECRGRPSTLSEGTQRDLLDTRAPEAAFPRAGR